MRPALCLLLALLAPAAARAALPLAAARSGALDLEVAGLPGGVRYARWADLRALPAAHVAIDDEFLARPQEATVVFLSDLWRALGAGADRDCLLARCSDGYLAVFTADFIARYRPFLVLEVAGRGPAQWPGPGMKDDPGPYVITVSDRLVPAAARFLDIKHKKPWNLTRIEFVRYAERFAGSYAGPWAALSARAQAGRTIWINCCACCHEGPDGTEGGTKSGRPFAFVQAIAQAKPSLFRRYVRDPQAVIASAQMEAHPGYTPAQLDAVAAFVTAEGP
jgi:hypothetical protein